MSSGGLTSSAELSSSLRGGRGGAGTPSNCYHHHHHHHGSSLSLPPLCIPCVKSILYEPTDCGQPSSPAPSSNDPLRSFPSITRPKLYCNTKGQVIVVCKFLRLIAHQNVNSSPKPHIFDSVISCLYPYHCIHGNKQT